MFASYFSGFQTPQPQEQKPGRNWEPAETVFLPAHQPSLNSGLHGLSTLLYFLMSPLMTFLRYLVPSSEKAMAPHSSTLAWKIAWTEEPTRLRPTGLLSRIRLSDFTFSFHFHSLEKEMATHSSVLAWRIPGTGEPDGLPSIGSHRVWHDWSDLAPPAAVPSCCVGPVKITPHLDFCLWTPSLRGLYYLNLQFWVHRERVKTLLPAFFFSSCLEIFEWALLEEGHFPLAIQLFMHWNHIYGVLCSSAKRHFKELIAWGFPAWFWMG